MVLALLLPAIVVFLLFTIWPLAKVALLSLQRTNFIKTQFVGIANYIDSVKNPEFIQALWNSCFYVLFIVIGQVLLSLIFALAIYPMNKKWHDTARIMIYLPTLSAGIIIASVWKWVFHVDGLVNWILFSFGFDKIYFFAQGSTAIPAISVIVIISSFGSYFIILLASLIGIDNSIIEAAKIDGASYGQIKRKILIPMILPTIELCSLLSCIAAMQVFETIYSLCPQIYASTITFHIYQQGFQFSNYGMASAQAVILAICILILSLLKKKVEHEKD